MRLISFSLTTAQFKARTKTVTRRLGWGVLKPGDHVMGCEKVMGRKRGEPLVRLGEIEIVSVRREPLYYLTTKYAYGHVEVVREGFPEMKPHEFVAFFCATHGKKVTRRTRINRIEFRYV